MILSSLAESFFTKASRQFISFGYLKAVSRYPRPLLTGVVRSSTSSDPAGWSELLSVIGTG
ncbi:hypothetical protein IP76_21110 [Rhizobium sp. AAP43]|nr:hypothetical protein IP76_21110 [Rhizobium sp. AAP43]